MKALFYVLTVLFWFSLYAYQSNFTPYLTLIGAAPSAAGLIIGSYGIMQFACRLPFGVLADRFKMHKVLIFAGLGFGVISALIFLLTENLVLVFIARTFAGITASAWVNILVLFSRGFKSEDSVKAVGLLSFFNNTGQLLGMQLGALLVGAAGYKSAFGLSLALTLVCFIPAALIKKEDDDGNQPPSLNVIKSVVADKRLLSVSAVAIGAQFITFGITFGFLTRYADTVLHTTPVENGILTVVPYIPAAVGSLALANLLAGRIKEPTLIFSGMMLMAVFTFITPFVTEFWPLVFVQTFVGLGRGISFPLLMGLAIKHVRTEHRGTAMGVFQSVYSIGIIFGPVFSGVIDETFSISHIFFLFGGACLLLAVWARRVIKRNITA